MKFQEWIATQETRKWGPVDAVSVQMIEDWYSEYDIFDEDKMERVFWNKVNIHGSHYMDMVRIQAANHTFDPLVSRYLEALLQTSGRDSSTGGSHTTSSDSREESGSETWQGSDITTRQGSNTDSGRTDTGSTGYSGRVHEVAKNGSVKEQTTGDAAKNFTRDGTGSKDRTAHIISTSTSTKRSGQYVTTDEQMDAAQVTDAVKAAPMTAVNLARSAGNSGPTGSGDSYAAVANGSMGQQSWTSASQYSERGSRAGSSKRHTEGYQGDNTVVSTEGNATANYDETTYGRNQQTGTDVTRTTTYNGFNERSTDTGSEIRNDTIGKSSQESQESIESTHAPRTTSGNSSGSSDTDVATNSTRTSEGENWNRYTGREGLTPQEGFASALRYMKEFNNCIMWFIEQLSPCFINVWEV